VIRTETPEQLELFQRAAVARAQSALRRRKLRATQARLAWEVDRLLALRRRHHES
jgi:hypothetical protein